jgi:hypothetical protein
MAQQTRGRRQNVSIPVDMDAALERLRQSDRRLKSCTDAILHAVRTGLNELLGAEWAQPPPPRVTRSRKSKDVDDGD